MGEFEQWLHESEVDAYANPCDAARIAWNHQQSKIEQLETKNKALVHALVNTNAEKTKWVHDYWNQAERLAEYCSMLMSSESELTVSCFQKKKKIEQLEKKLSTVTNLLNDLKTERKDFKEFDLYDKGYRVTTDYIIRDLEEALRGECE